MPRVEIQLCGRSYPISCEPGSEARLQQLANYVDTRMRDMSGRGGPALSELRLLLLTNLMLADEILELRQDKSEGKTAQPIGLSAEDEALLLAAIEELAARVENLNAEI